MFFRRKQAPKLSASERLDGLKQQGFDVTRLNGSGARVARGGYAIDITDDEDVLRATGRSGLLWDGEIAALVDGGFQKFFRTPSGRRKPATAQELMELHDFEEDLKEALGQKSYYNESLGTVSTFYLYDRVKDRDRGVPPRPWE